MTKACMRGLCVGEERRHLSCSNANVTWCGLPCFELVFAGFEITWMIIFWDMRRRDYLKQCHRNECRRVSLWRWKKAVGLSLLERAIITSISSHARTWKRWRRSLLLSKICPHQYETIFPLRASIRGDFGKTQITFLHKSKYYFYPISI